jgi:hypothetical protein
VSDAPAGMTRLAPGVYDDGKGGMHLDAVEFLEASGYAATRENVDRLMHKAREIADTHGLSCYDVDDG